MNVYIKHIDDGSDSLTHYGVKGMKWHKHLKGKMIDSLENRLLDREREFETNYAANASSSSAERKTAKLALKAREEAKKRKTLKYRASTSLLKTKKKAIAKGKGVYDRLRNKNKSSERKHFNEVANKTKKEVVSKQVKSAVRDVKIHKPKTVIYTKSKGHYQTGMRGTPKKKIETYKQSTVYHGPAGLAVLTRDSRTNKKEKQKRAKYSR